MVLAYMQNQNQCMDFISGLWRIKRQASSSHTCVYEQLSLQQTYKMPTAETAWGAHIMGMDDMRQLSPPLSKTCSGLLWKWLRFL